MSGTESLEASPPEGRDRARIHLIEVAGALLADEGPQAVTTRAVAAAAGVQPPTIYRLFGDKDGLLEAVAEHALARHVGTKAIDESADPLDDLRAGWDLHISFGLANPSVFLLMADPRRAATSRAAAAGRQVLLSRIHRIAAAGLLRVGEHHAAELAHAVGTGTVLTLLATPDHQRHLTLADTAYRAVIGTIAIAAPAIPAPGPIGAAAALRATAPELTGLTPAERHLLTEWLDRITDHPSPQPGTTQPSPP